jgi:predicted metal-dependent TIM-barrel fold hydrolase
MMKLIDPHVHMDALTKNSLELMAITGIVAVLGDGAPSEGLAISASAVTDFFERTLVYDTRRGSEAFIKVYTLLGVNMFGVPPDYEKVLETLAQYLTRERVVGLGEIGLDPNSRRCPDLNQQEEILKAELNMAREYDKAVLLHLPSAEKARWVERYFTCIDDAGLRHDKAVLTHADSSVIKMITDYGCIAAITVSPMRRITAADGAKMLQGVDLGRMLVNSDSILQHPSDPLSVPKTAFEMRRLGFSDKEVGQVFLDNPRRIFSLR